MIEHLLLSSVVLGLAIVAGRTLPLTARTRHALLLVGFAKFAIPASLFDVFGVQHIVIPTSMHMFGGEAVASSTRIQAEWDAVRWIRWMWIGIASSFFLRWLILRARTVEAALRDATPASARELAARDDARRALGVTVAVDIVRSTVCEAPAVVRVIRPTIIIPPNSDALSDDELRSLLLHECAHVRRRDNLVSIVEALTAAVLFFNPVVWLALRDLAIAREEACDEAVSDVVREPATYVDALIKICRTALAPRTAGASCMASARLKERMNHLMNYARIKEHALAHRLVLSAACMLVFTITTAASAIDVERGERLRQIYKLEFDITASGDTVHFDTKIVELGTGRAVVSPRLNPKPGQWATITHHDGPRAIELRLRGENTGEATLLLFVRENGAIVQRNAYTFSPKASSSESQQTYTGEPVSLTLRDADLQDVLKMFAQITGLKLEVNPEIKGTVTLDVTAVPWDDVLDRIAKEQKLTIRVENGTMIVTR